MEIQIKGIYFIIQECKKLWEKYYSLMKWQEIL